MTTPRGELPALRGRARYGVPLALLLALPAAFFAGYWQSERKLGPLLAESRVQTEQLQVRTAELEQLRRQLVVQESGARLAQQAAERSRQTIKQLEQQIFQLQQELATYKEVLAPGSARHGLQIRAFELQATEDPRRFRYKILLSRVGSAEQMLEGSLQIELRGHLKGQAKALPLIEALPAEGLAFAFRHFQAIPEGVRFAELQLPEDFEPQEVRLRASVKGQSQPLERRFSWRELQ
jgi:hypothetical protein